MTELFKLIFTNFWTFAGTCILLYILCRTIVSGFQGLVILFYPKSELAEKSSLMDKIPNSITGKKQEGKD